jgi:hypothetical protein
MILVDGLLDALSVLCQSLASGAVAGAQRRRRRRARDGADEALGEVENSPEAVCMGLSLEHFRAKWIPVRVKKMR